MKNNNFFMNAALKEAKKAYAKGEVPVGAILVDSENRIIIKAHNLMETKKDPTAHAELLCIRKGAIKMRNWRLNGLILYTTLEPCPMCLGSMILSRIKKVIWGARDLRHGSCGSWVNLHNTPHPIHQLEFESGVLQEPCSAILKDFFKLRRKHEISQII